MPTSNDQTTWTSCKVCSKPSKAKGLCNRHYTEAWKKENPERAKEITARYRERNREKYSAQHKEYYQANRDRLLRQQKMRDMLRVDEKRDYNRKYVKENRESLREYFRAWRLATKYGISMDDYQAMLDKQGGVCAICNGKQNSRQRDGTSPLHVDHDHTTGKVRGLLCMKCNTVLHVLENQEWVSLARAYLELP